MARIHVPRFTAVGLWVAALALLPLHASAQIGVKVAGFSIADTDDRVHTLEEYSGKILVLEFWSFKCPVALSYNERLAELQSRYRNRGVAFLAIASNKNESPVEVKRNRENLKLPFPVLLDRDGAMADRLGATYTPSIVILDGAGMLRYRGAIDNNKRIGEKGRIAYAEEVLDALLGGRPAPQSETQVFGCSIRR
jgi:peroxiredoxin